jgi:hypothetical protein
MSFDKSIKIQNNRRALAKEIAKTYKLYMTPKSCIIRYCLLNAVRLESDALSYIEKEVKRILYARSLI